MRVKLIRDLGKKKMIFNLSGCLVIRLFSCPVVSCQLSGSMVVPLSGCPVVRLSGCLVVRLSSCPVAQLFFYCLTKLVEKKEISLLLDAADGVRSGS